MMLVVFGANGPTGRQLVRQALAAGHDVVAVTRKPRDYPITDPRLQVAEADVTDPHQVRAALAGADAVVATYGVPYSRRRVTVYSEGLRNIVAAMRSAGVERLVCVTSTSIAPGDAPGESFFWRKVLVPIFLRRLAGRTVYDDMDRMEALVSSSGTTWTIVRPGGLFNTDQPTGDPEVSTGRIRGRMTSRADLAQTLLREAEGSEHAGMAIEVISRSQLPSFRTFLRDAFRSH